MNKEKINWSLYSLELPGHDEVHIIWNNLPEQMEAAFINWSVRTEDITPESFCRYINSKRERGLTDHYAYTEEQFRDLK